MKSTVTSSLTVVGIAPEECDEDLKVLFDHLINLSTVFLSHTSQFCVHNMVFVYFVQSIFRRVLTSYHSLLFLPTVV